uniref:Uncharacterized protein n=1 Tax=Anguilla anguilla TaxID=7936 RepID=A0A0E9SGE2_ANGAN
MSGIKYYMTLQLLLNTVIFIAVQVLSRHS